MSWLAALGDAFALALALFNYFTSKDAAKTAAAQALANQLTTLETQGQPVMRDILVAQGRSSWVDWNNVPPLPISPPGPTSS